MSLKPATFKFSINWKKTLISEDELVAAAYNALMEGGEIIKKYAYETASGASKKSGLPLIPPQRVRVLTGNYRKNMFVEGDKPEKTKVVVTVGSKCKDPKTGRAYAFDVEYRTKNFELALLDKHKEVFDNFMKAMEKLLHRGGKVGTGKVKARIIKSKWVKDKE